jgi:hypothetical protein
MWRGAISALQRMAAPRNRSRWIFRGDSTRSRIDAEDSADSISAISSGVSAATSPCRSMRSSSGPEIRAT